jgi:hypothetical protein
MWAIGFIQYEILTGQHPIIGSDVMTVEKYKEIITSRT